MSINFLKEDTKMTERYKKKIVFIIYHQGNENQNEANYTNDNDTYHTEQNITPMILTHITKNKNKQCCHGYGLKVPLYIDDGNTNRSDLLVNNMNTSQKCINEL